MNIFNLYGYSVDFPYSKISIDEIYFALIPAKSKKRFKPIVLFF